MKNTVQDRGYGGRAVWVGGNWYLQWQSWAFKKS